MNDVPCPRPPAAAAPEAAVGRAYILKVEQEVSDVRDTSNLGQLLSAER